MTLLIPIIVIVVLLVIVAVVLPKLKAAGSGEPHVEEGATVADVGLYVRRSYLLTAAEYSDYKVLHQVLPAEWQAFLRDSEDNLVGLVSWGPEDCASPDGAATSPVVGTACGGAACDVWSTATPRKDSS